MPRARVRSSPLESLGGARVLAGAVAAWAPLLCAESNFTQNKRKYLQVVVDTWRVGINQQYCNAYFLMYVYLCNLSMHPEQAKRGSFSDKGRVVSLVK